MSHTAVVFALFFSIIPLAAAQSQPPTIRVEIGLQPIEVQVKDAKGDNIRDLSANDFTVAENGKPQKIAFFDAGNGPVAVAILVDSSDSMYENGRPGSAASVAAQFMATARPVLIRASRFVPIVPLVLGWWLQRQASTGLVCDPNRFRYSASPAQDHSESNRLKVCVLH